MQFVSSSTSTLGKEGGYLLDRYSGAHKVTYHPLDDWDFELDTAHHHIDLSLVLPHYRARSQPIDHRMSMFLGSETGSIKVKVCRHVPRSKFYLEIQAKSDVTVWLPSDFRGRIHHSGKKACYSAGFVNRILCNATVNTDTLTGDSWLGDEVLIHTKGVVEFRMWDVNTGSPENARKETLKRIFGCSAKVPETPIDWDFLLED